MNQNLLNTFVVLYECGSMHKAAEYLYISQQGISKSIHSLEEEFGVKLFERSNVGVEPTLAGDVLYQDALKFRDQYNSLCRKMKDAGSGRRVISLACAYGTLYRLYPVLKEFEQQNPNISVRWQELTDIEVEKKILQEQADLAINVGGSKREYVKFIPLYSCKVCLLVYEGHPLYQAKTIRFQDLQGEKIVIEGEQFRINSLFRTFCERANVHPEIIAETAEIGFCQHMAGMREGLAVTIDFIAQERKISGVRAIPFEDPEFFWQAGLEFPEGGKRSDAEERLIHFIQAHFS